MKTLVKGPGSAAIASLFLGLPFIIFFSLILLGIEPNFGPLEPLFSAQGGRVGSLFVFAAYLLLLWAFILNTVWIVRCVRSEAGISPVRVNLLLAVPNFCFLAGFIAGIIIDQYPCLQGVPNCD